MKNTDWIDNLSRALGQGASRRGTLRTTVAALMAGLAATFSPSTAPSKRKHNKRTRKKGKKGHGGSKQTGSCHLDQSAEAAILLVEVADSFEGKPLTLVHRATLPAAGDFMQQTIVKLSQDLVLQFDVDKPSGVESRLRARYGIGVDGIRESVFIISLDDGTKSVGGSIDGRDLVPRLASAVKQDPDGWEFADGSQLPVPTIDPDLLAAVKSVLDRAKAEAASCSRGQPRIAAANATGDQALPGLLAMSDWLSGGVASAKKSKRNRRARKHPGRVTAEYNPSVCDEVTLECMTCWGGCWTALDVCCWFALLGCGFCYLTYEECLDGCDSGACCPVECGSDMPTTCCCEGETCCEGNCCDQETEACWPGGVCCKKGLDFCLGECCPPGTTCKEGVCCGENEDPCFGACCPSEETCRERDLCCPREVVDCNGVCCPNKDDSCQGDVCCPLDQSVCGTTCCEVGEICKPPEGGGELDVCCPPELVCNQVCCDDLGRCLDPEHSTCCSIFHEICNGICCDLGEVCLGRACCPAGQVCGQTCCPAGNFCGDPASADCRACDEGYNPCPLDIEGAPNCCPKDTLCCGNGDCCPPGVPCCDKGGGLKCDPNCLT